jgi:hypothetical protein
LASFSPHHYFTPSFVICKEQMFFLRDIPSFFTLIVFKKKD